jgi:A/G-specific adenine glycosylase
MPAIMTKNGKESLQKEFSGRLLKWNRDENDRQMPWKGEKDPYRIWLSEIILQQTRVEQGLKYYNNFISTFPTIQQLANAPEDKVFKLWEGLGYYSRCRNLITTAKYIATEKKGKFPDSYEEIKSLKGIGPYTAAAISSFAFNLPHAVVDGNVFRVLARIFGVDKPIDSTEGKKYFTELADQLLDKKQPGLYNQAIMDFGATICKPANPLCTNCVFKENCFAFLHNRINELPVKEKKITTRKRWFYYFVIQYKGQTAIRQRIAKDIWQQLFEFPMFETEEEKDIKKVIILAEKKGWLQKGVYDVLSFSPLYKQQLSHQLIAARFITIQLNTKPETTEDPMATGWQWKKTKSLIDNAFPQIINQYLKKTKEQSLF